MAFQPWSWRFCIFCFKVVFPAKRTLIDLFLFPLTLRFGGNRARLKRGVTSSLPGCMYVNKNLNYKIYSFLSGSAKLYSTSTTVLGGVVLGVLRLGDKIIT